VRTRWIPLHIIVGGGGRLGAYSATRFSAEGEDVVVVDPDELSFDRLGSGFNGETVSGSVIDRDMLEQAGVARADGVIAVTRYDNANLMAVEIASHLYGVKRVVARLYNPERESSYQKLGVRYVSATGFLAKQFMNEFREGTYRQHLSFPHGEIAVVDIRLGEKAHGLAVSDLERDRRLRVCAIERGDRMATLTEQRFVRLPHLHGPAPGLHGSGHRSSPGRSRRAPRVPGHPRRETL
jgi:trk system potassium uptake protein